jgi:hypothetical protein
MYQSRVGLVLTLCSALALWACSRQPTFVAKNEPWRSDEERACLASGAVRETPFVTTRSALGGPSSCGAIQPFTVSATARGAVTLEPPALLRCPMIPAVDHWMERVVIPAARHHLRTNVVAIKVAGSYSCRPMNHVIGARLSEHGHANALDVAGFVLEGGAARCPSRTFCGQCTAAPATSSPPCSAPTTTLPTTTISILISPATAPKAASANNSRDRPARRRG